MALIKLTASELENVQSQISKMSSKASDCANNVSSVRNNLDMEISAKRNIEERLDNINRNLTKHSESLKSYANVLNDVINEFVKTDSKESGIKNSGWIGSSIIGSGIAAGILKDNLWIFNGGMLPEPSGGHPGTDKWRINNGLTALSTSASLFGGTMSLMPMDNSFLSGLFETGKDAKEFNDVIGTVMSLFNEGEVPDWFDDFTGGFGDGFGIISDIKTAIEAVQNQDVEALGDLLGKYGIKKPLKEIVKTTIGGASAEVGLVVDLLYSDFESAIDVSKEIATDFTNVISNPNSNIIDYAKVIGEIYRAPDKVITQGFINVVGDYADSIGGILDNFGIVDAPEEGYIEAYKDAFSDIKEMFNTFGVEDTTSILVDSFKETVSEQFSNTMDTLANIGGGISNFFKGMF